MTFLTSHRNFSYMPNDMLHHPNLLSIIIPLQLTASAPFASQMCSKHTVQMPNCVHRMIKRKPCARRRLGTRFCAAEVATCFVIHSPANTGARYGTFKFDELARWEIEGWHVLTFLAFVWWEMLGMIGMRACGKTSCLYTILIRRISVKKLSNR